MKNVHNGLGVKNISDLILKEIYGIYGTKNLNKSKLENKKWLKEKFLKKYANLSEDGLSEKSNKNVYVKNDVMTTVIKRCRGEKKEAKEK